MAHGDAPALVPPATAVAKPQVTSPGFGSPQWWQLRWGVGAGLSSGGSRGKVVKGELLGSLYRAKSPVGM
jgi:hypothetical protein